MGGALFRRAGADALGDPRSGDEHHVRYQVEPEHQTDHDRERRQERVARNPDEQPAAEDLEHGQPDGSYQHAPDELTERDADARQDAEEAGEHHRIEEEHDDEADDARAYLRSGRTEVGPEETDGLGTDDREGGRNEDGQAVAYGQPHVLQFLHEHAGLGPLELEDGADGGAAGSQPAQRGDQQPHQRHNTRQAQNPDLEESLRGDGAALPRVDQAGDGAVDELEDGIAQCGLRFEEQSTNGESQPESGERGEDGVEGDPGRHQRTVPQAVTAHYANGLGFGQPPDPPLQLLQPPLVTGLAALRFTLKGFPRGTRGVLPRRAGFQAFVARRWPCRDDSGSAGSPPLYPSTVASTEGRPR